MELYITLGLSWNGVFAAQHKAIVRKVSQTKTVHHGLGMDLEKANFIQTRIDDFTKRLSDLLRIERDAELEFTQEELNAVPAPDKSSDSPKPIEFLVSHGQAEQELCDTICNLNAVSTSTGHIIKSLSKVKIDNSIVMHNDLLS